MKISIFAVLTFALTCSVFAGTKEDLEVVQRNLLEMQRQFWDLEKELRTNNAAVQDTVKKLQGASDEMRDNQASLNAKLESILNKIQALDEKLNETNLRIKELSTQLGASPATQSPEAQTRGPSASGEQVQPTPSPGGITKPVPPASAAGVADQQLLQQATALYSQGRFEQALRGFQDLLDQYPGSRLSDDAQFMIGESYYGMKEYVDAVSEYDKVIKTYPDSDRVPGARLKKAFSFFSLGKKGQGVVELQQIVERYPTTKEAQIAKQRLNELGLD